MLTAPFNFVPLNDRVFFPEWAELVSHDIPFKESCSGEIEVTITAKSPIFVRDHDNPECFCQYDETYYIPGSSVKGEIRSIFEILTFSKMGLDSFDDSTYAVRDLRNKKLYMSQMSPEKIYCGWLKKKEDGYVIENCGKPVRISHSEIDRMFKIYFSTKFKSGNFQNNNSEMKTARYKYELLDGKSLSGRFRYSHKDVNRSIYVYDPQGDFEGTIVLTGQASARKEPKKAKASGKHYEFIFRSQSIEEIVVEKDLMEKFKFAYFDGRETEPKESEDWGYWKQKLKDGKKVPVFFQKQGSKIKHFGLSYLYKLPYSYSIKDGIPENHFDKRHDMTEVVFGYVDEQDALKGRVQFSHFKCVSHNGELPLKRVVLGTPRASYYPMYIRQNSGGDYVTYMDANFKIAGRKRYPVHKKGVKPENLKDTDNENILTKFKPLKEGAVFEGKIRFHNLRPEELGALFSALTFHGTTGCYHSIGLAKPLGYGKVEMKLRSSFDQDSYMKRFEFAIGKQISNWHRSPSITELLTMASEQDNRDNSALEYMPLKDFAKCKNSKVFLKPYSKLKGVKSVDLKSLLNEEDYKKLEDERSRLEQEIKDKKNLADAWHRAKSSDTIDSYRVFIEKYPNSSEAEIAHKRVEEIAKDREEAKQKERIEEADSKLKKIIKLDSKLKRQALEYFIDRYADTPIVERAKRELEAFNSADKQKSFDIDDLSSALAKCDDLSHGFKIIKKYLSNKGGRADDMDREHIREFYEENVQKLTNKKKRARESKKYKNWVDKSVIDKYL